MAPVVEAPAPRARLAHAAQAAAHGILGHPDGHLLLLPRRVPEDVLRVNFEPAPHVRLGRAAKVIGLRCAEREEAADRGRRAVAQENPQRPVTRHRFPVGHCLASRPHVGRVTPPADLAGGLRHLKIVGSRPQRRIEVQGKPRIVGYVPESFGENAFAGRAAGKERQRHGRAPRVIGGKTSAHRLHRLVHRKRLPQRMPGNDLGRMVLLRVAHGVL